MKYLLLVVFVLLPSYLISSKNSIDIEIKDRSGKNYVLTTHSKPNSKATRYLPHVCYEQRVKVKSNNSTYMKYGGCIRSKISCRIIGFNHFGTYDNDYASSQGYVACLNHISKN